MIWKAVKIVLPCVKLNKELKIEIEIDWFIFLPKFFTDSNIYCSLERRPLWLL